VLEPLRVSRLTRLLKELLESDIRLSELWIEGEVTNHTRSAPGHNYFSMKDGDCQIRCVMFSRPYARGGSQSGAPIQNGSQILAHGNVSFYEQRGETQLVVDFVQPAGIGARGAEFERLKEQLAAEGLFDVSRKRPLPKFPQRIGVVTSPAGAVFHDICNVLERRWPLAEVVLAPTPVQGTQAAAGVVAAIRQLTDQGNIDVVIVARGGGSVEELWPFNEEVVARAIYASSVPVVSAIGHETDFTIADFTADVRAPTPSAAAETVVPDRFEVSRRIEGALAAASMTALGRIRQHMAAIERAGDRVHIALPELNASRERVSALLQRTGATVERKLAQHADRLHSYRRELNSLNPAATLTRGYAVVQRREGKEAVTSTKQVKGRDRLDVFVKDGRFPAEVSRQYGF